MQTATIESLIRLNQVFYMTYADSFHKTRQSPWNGWNDILPLLPTQTESVYVDVGSGNGRWFRFLTEHQVSITSAIGFDLDTYMLGQARFSFIKDSRFRFYQSDCIDSIDDCLAHVGTPQVITSFGLWHHIPSYELRLTLLKKLFERVSPGGTIVVSCWQFAADDTYRSKLISPSIVVQQTGIDPAEFEQGDYFLGWRSEASILRYCHSFSDEEINSLVREIGTPFSLVKGNGNDVTNTYVILTRSPV